MEAETEGAIPADMPIERATLIARPMDVPDVRPVAWERETLWLVPCDSL